MLAYSQFGEPPEYEGLSESMFQLYRLRTAQCLIIGDIAKCLPYTLETLRYNATAELNRKDDSGRGLWITTSLIVRAAVSMGYHRDPLHTPAIPPMQAEYRRRTWLAVIETDEVASFLAGLPCMLPTAFSDTVEPRNLHDWELREDLTELPPARPLTEQTAITYMIMKGRIFQILGQITNLNHSLGQVSNEAVMRVDAALISTYEAMPPQMKLADTFHDGTVLRDRTAISAFSLECLYHYGMLKLHRRFLSAASRTKTNAVSQKRCISSALRLLQRQRLLQPFWYKTAETRRMLSLAVLILILELEQRKEATNLADDDDVIRQAVVDSVELCRQAVDSCDEVRALHKLLAGMLSSYKVAPSGIAAQASATDKLGADTSYLSSHAWARDNLYSVVGTSESSLDTDLDWVSFQNVS
jgi:hypothetical protein